MIVGAVNNKTFEGHPKRYIDVYKQFGWQIAIQVYIATHDKKQHCFLDLVMKPRKQLIVRGISK